MVVREREREREGRERERRDRDRDRQRRSLSPSRSKIRDCKRHALGLKPPKSSVLLLAYVNSGNCSPKFALLYLLMSYKAILSCIMYRFRRVVKSDFVRARHNSLLFCSLIIEVHFLELVNVASLN
ncbi:hypothetical protein D5086_009776 [Populus alba]|uniref:Uncharacterized protein n=1 Tax=Populus alba TaxID=43335 RepID=A0ACC4C8Z7_POPAL